VTWLASKPIVEDSLDIAQSLAKQWTRDNRNDPRLPQLSQIVKHLSDLLHTPPDQMVLDGTSTIEDYLYDAKQPQMAAQVKQELDLIAKWRRQQRPLKSSEQNASTKTGDGLGISLSFADLPRTEPTQPKQTGPEIRGESLSKDGCGP
jgi:hypothetical protein